MNQSSSVTPSANPKALLPILLFLTVYLGNGIFFEYIKPTEGQMGFYVVSVVLAFSIALIAAFLQNRKLSFDEKIHICARGIGDDNIVIMLFIFLMAGAFSGIASEAGGASSTANLLLSIIPGKFAVPGLFLIACLISMAMGTSVGTISVLAPIACAVSQNGGLSLPFCVGVVVGGAMFGDNLSFISDTTIAATKTQGVEMKDKFRTNIRVAIPAAAITLVILLVYAFVSGGAVIGNFPFNIWQALPYFIVLGMSVLYGPDRRDRAVHSGRYFYGISVLRNRTGVHGQRDQRHVRDHDRHDPGGVDRSADEGERGLRSHPVLHQEERQQQAGRNVRHRFFDRFYGYCYCQ